FRVPDPQLHAQRLHRGRGAKRDAGRLRSCVDAGDLAREVLQRPGGAGGAGAHIERTCARAAPSSFGAGQLTTPARAQLSSALSWAGLMLPPLQIKAIFSPRTFSRILIA